MVPQHVHTDKNCPSFQEMLVRIIGANLLKFAVFLHFTSCSLVKVKQSVLEVSYIFKSMEWKSIKWL
jgi:hypothetical protein